MEERGRRQERKREIQESEERERVVSLNLCSVVSKVMLCQARLWGVRGGYVRLRVRLSNVLQHTLEPMKHRSIGTCSTGGKRRKRRRQLDRRTGSTQHKEECARCIGERGTGKIGEREERGEEMDEMCRQERAEGRKGFVSWYIQFLVSCCKITGLAVTGEKLCWRQKGKGGLVVCKIPCLQLQKHWASCDS